MSQHLKTRVIRRLKSVDCTFVSLPAGSTPHKRGVYYFRFCAGVDCYWGTMDHEKEGRQYRKRIIVRPSRFRDGLFELYTYHLPKHWSAACVANRELIKEAQRQAHALEHDHSFVGIEWRVRFFLHYYRVFKGGAKPEPGMKPYSRFYQYTYVALYRQLKAAASREQASLTTSAAQPAASTIENSVEFEEIGHSEPLFHHQRTHALWKSPTSWSSPRAGSSVNGLWSTIAPPLPAG